MDTTALIEDAVLPRFAGTAFGRHAIGSSKREGPARRSAYLLWCVPTSDFRQRHPGVPEALDPDHLDGCTDLVIEVDDHAILRQADLEALDVAPDLIGRPIAEVLPELTDRIAELLRRDGPAT
ncbi:MAG: hypothetical protein WBP61_04510 [Nocardioides sp.]